MAFVGEAIAGIARARGRRRDNRDTSKSCYSCSNSLGVGGGSRWEEEEAHLWFGDDHPEAHNPTS